MGIKEVSVLYVICPQSHLLRSILHPTESLAIGPHVSPLCLSSGPGPGRPPCQLHDEALDCTWLRQNLFPCGCRTEGFSFWLAFAWRVYTASNGHLQFLSTGASTTYQQSLIPPAQQADSRTSVLARQSLIKGNLLPEVTSHQLCHVLLVRSRSRCCSHSVETIIHQGTK